MFELSLQSNLIVGVLYFDTIYNYGRAQFLHKQRIMVLGDSICGIFHDVNNNLNIRHSSL